MRRTPIRVKLAAALALPLAASGALTVHEVSETAGEAAALRQEADLARSAMGPSGIITTLQDERTWAALEILGFEDGVALAVGSAEESRDRVDEAVARFRRAIAGDEEASRAFAPALQALDALEGLRADVDAQPKGVGMAGVAFGHEMFDRYTELVAPFFDATTRISVDIGDEELRQGTKLVDTSARQVEVLSELLNTTLSLAYLTPGGIDTSAEVAEVSMLRAAFARNSEALRAPAAPFDGLAAAFPAELTEGIDGYVGTAVSTGTVELEPLTSVIEVPRDRGYLGYQDALHALVNARADELDRQANRRQTTFAWLAVGALAATVVLTWLVSRSITRPLRSLTLQAREVAEHRLPRAVREVLEAPLGTDVTVADLRPVVVRTRDEVAEVVTALNNVQESALDLAVEQAVLRRNIADSFVNLGRRNQNLLSRQLDFITRLESGESDPATLDALFRLDHLATRMRRNAESLLFLAGVEPPRRFAAPLQVADVIRSALGEVEDYERARAGDVEPATLQGGVAVDLAHLLAELIENALTFSPPGHPVELTGRWAARGRYVLVVRDHGPGMSAEQVAVANRRLSGEESFTVAPSRYLGHYVTGSLAGRHGIGLHLDGASGRGVSVTVTIPPHLVVAEWSSPGSPAAPAVAR